MQLKIKEEDLVLNISSSYNPNNFDINKYEGFIDKLCGTREYQKQAIKKTCIYLIGGRYSSLLDLAEENFSSNQILQEKHKKFDKFKKKLQLKDKLSCNIDLATGTGKSYVIYGIAQIMLCEGLIDKVLVLAPSVTIEEGLTSKFKNLSFDRDLKNLLPKGAIYKNPKIIQATQTIEEGTICIENIHSTYKNTKSAIGDSILGIGERTLVLNDESHHIYSKPNRENTDLKKWYEFLNNNEFNFKYIVGFTGTPYIENEYFTDVIYRYSILEGMDDKFIKKVNYIKDTDKTIDSSSRMQLILQNHKDFVKKYTKVKPITILISKDIKNCEKDKKDLIDFLHKEEGINKEELEKKVLIVTSNSKHKNNLDILKTVSDKKNSVEWICSVAMLTEGWDVPNVFQIVPSEEKAFNSKLLISQVIGRGLRIPEEYRGEDLFVTVLNHTKFSESINHLVDEILEKEDRIYSYPVIEKNKYDFSIYNLEYDEDQIEEAKSNDYKAPSFSEDFNLFADDEEEEFNLTFGVLGSEKEEERQFIVKKDTKTIDELSQEIYNKIQAWCIELESEGANEEELEKLEELDFNAIKSKIQKSLNKKGLNAQKISKENCGKILGGFGIIKRFGSKNVRYRKEPKDVIKLNVYNQEGLGKSGVALSTIKKGKAYIFYDENSEKLSDDEDRKALQILGGEAGGNYFIRVQNSFLNKTPLNLNVASSNPEKQFFDCLLNEKNKNIIDGFFKSKDKGFYDIEYRWIHGTRTSKTGKFNPDFFIKSGEKILVIEIKGTESEKEYSRSFIQNKAKYLQAKKHFEDLNKKLASKGIKQKYYFHFCSPKDYRVLFKYLENGNIEKFTSRLDSSFKESLFKDSKVKLLEFFDDTNLKEVFGEKWEILEEDTKTFLRTGEKNYFDNIENKSYNFSGGELIKAFELELRNKVFDKVRENEEISHQIIDEEKQKDKYNNFKAIDYFNYANEYLDLGAMENLLTHNKSIISYIKGNFENFDFVIGSNWNNKNLIKEEKFGKFTDYKDLPNFIGLIRLKYRNKDIHGEKVIIKEELEDLRKIMLYEDKIILKLQTIK